MAGSTPASAIAEPVLATATRPRASVSPWLEAWRRFRRHKLAVLGLVVLIVMIAMVAFGPLVWRVQTTATACSARLNTPAPTHPFGTDDLGQDILARMLYGGRISLAVGLSA